MMTARVIDIYGAPQTALVQCEGNHDDEQWGDDGGDLATDMALAAVIRYIVVVDYNQGRREGKKLLEKLPDRQ